MNKRVVLALVVLGGCLLVASVVTKGNLVLTALSLICFGLALRTRMQIAAKSSTSVSVSSMDQMRRDMRTMMNDVSSRPLSSNNVSK